MAVRVTALPVDGVELLLLRVVVVAVVELLLVDVLLQAQRPSDIASSAATAAKLWMLCRCMESSSSRAERSSSLLVRVGTARVDSFRFGYCLCGAFPCLAGTGNTTNSEFSCEKIQMKLTSALFLGGSPLAKASIQSVTDQLLFGSLIRRKQPEKREQFFFRSQIFSFTRSLLYESFCKKQHSPGEECNLRGCAVCFLFWTFTAAALPALQRPMRHSSGGRSVRLPS